MKNQSTPIAQLWDAIDEIENLAPVFEEISASGTKYRSAALSQVRRLRSVARGYVEAFDDGPAFDVHGPWRPVQSKDVAQVLDKVRHALSWIRASAIEGPQENSNKLATKALARELSGIVSAMGLKWEELK